MGNGMSKVPGGQRDGGQHVLLRQDLPPAAQGDACSHTATMPLNTTVCIFPFSFPFEPSST